MQSMLLRLKNSYSDINFEIADEFSWNPSNQTVYYNPHNTQAAALLLHEVSHAILGHDQYRNDVDLIKMERSAWQKAQSISSEYQQKIPQELIEGALDSYRDWLHARSTCPNCQAVGLQVKHNRYRCPACAHEWLVNEARNCRLMRYKVKNNP
jgi:hypothetical protein